MASSPEDVIYGMLSPQGMGQAFQNGLQAALAPSTGAYERLKPQLAQQQLVQGQMDIDAQRQAQQQAQDYQTAIGQWTQNGADPSELLKIAAAFPKQAEQAIGVYKQQNEASKTADRTYWGEVASAAGGGAPTLALTKLQQRRDAEAKAGRDTTDYDHAIAALNADPENGAKIAKAVATGHLFSIDPAAFAKSVAGDEESRNHFTPIGNGYVLDQRTGEATLVPGYGGGGDPSSGGGSFTPTVGGVPVTGDTPFSSVKDRIINHEAPPSVGGYNAVAYNLPGGTNSAGIQPANLTGMTIGQVLDYQKNVVRPATRGQRGPSDVGSTGVGAYQFESGTLAQNAAKTFGANFRNVPFTPANQDRIAETLWNTVRGSPSQLANTWAAFAQQRQSQGGSTVPSGGVGGLSAAAIDQAAQKYNLTGQFPKNFTRKADVQAAVLSRAAELANGQNVGGMLASQASREADTRGLNRLQSNASSVLAFERTALKNGALALRLGAQVGNGSIPIFNQWVNAGRKATGDGKVAAFHAALGSFADEYAKVVTSATGGGVTSDNARQEVYSRINAAQSPDQLVGVMQALQQDMENRRHGLETERSAILRRISGIPQPSQPPTSQASQSGGAFKILRVRPAQ